MKSGKYKCGPVPFVLPVVVVVGLDQAVRHVIDIGRRVRADGLADAIAVEVVGVRRGSVAGGTQKLVQVIVGVVGGERRAVTSLLTPSSARHPAAQTAG